MNPAGRHFDSDVELAMANISATLQSPSNSDTYNAGRTQAGDLNPIPSSANDPIIDEQEGYALFADIWRRTTEEPTVNARRWLRGQLHGSASDGEMELNRQLLRFRWVYCHVLRQELYTMLEKLDTVGDMSREQVRLISQKLLEFVKVIKDLEEIESIVGNPLDGKVPMLVNVVWPILRSLVGAFVGGVFFVVPMVIMTDSPSRQKILTTTSVAMVIFSVVLAAGYPRLKETELISIVAAYAAVLYVFVGVSLGQVTS